jgi:hypothetical protein
MIASSSYLCHLTALAVAETMDTLSLAAVARNGSRRLALVSIVAVVCDSWVAWQNVCDPWASWRVNRSVVYSYSYVQKHEQCASTLGGLVAGSLVLL